MQGFWLQAKSEGVGFTETTNAAIDAALQGFSTLQGMVVDCERSSCSRQNEKNK